MRISTNIPSIHINYLLKQNDQWMNKSLEKLSSGLKINRASDGASELAISQKMRGQIKGIIQAQRNIQDGISLIQTAEGGLRNIQENLQRQRELAVQAANSTLTNADRKEIQKEIDLLNKAISETAHNTKFNDIKLLNPEIEEDTPVEPAIPKLDIVFLIDDSSTMSTQIGMVKDGISGFVQNLQNWSDYKVAMLSVVHNNPLRRMAFTDDIQQMENQLDIHANVSAGNTRTYGYLYESLPNGSIGQGLGYRTDAQKVFIVLTDTYNESSMQNSSGTTITQTMAADALDEENVQVYVYGVRLSGSTNIFSQDAAYSEILAKTNGQLFKPSSANEIKNSLENELVQEIEENTPIPEEETPPNYMELKLQTGPNSQQSGIIQLHDFRPHIIGTHDLSVETTKNANEAIASIDNALQLVTEIRAVYGAKYNQLEHGLGNLMNYEENLTSSKSRLVDLNVAHEFMQYTKTKIINEATSSISVQANQEPEYVLQLLN